MTPEIQHHRQAWADEAHYSARLAVAVGGLALIGVIGAAAAWRLSPVEALVDLVLGAALWHAIVQGVDLLRAELERADLPDVLARHQARNATIGAILLVVLAAGPAILAIPALRPLLEVGGFGYAAALYAWQAYRSRQPRAFVHVANDDRVLEVAQGETLLNALERAGYRLMVQCPRKGECSACRVRITQGGPEEWPERFFGKVLTAKQRQQNWVVSCRVPVETDMVVALAKPLVLRWPDQAGVLAPTTRKIRQALPGFDCEACGYATCTAYAEAIAAGQAPITLCLPGGEAVHERLQEVAGELQWAGEEG